MHKILKIISGTAFLAGAMLIALMVIEIDLGLNAYRQFQLAFGLGVLGGLINLVNWESSEHSRLFTQFFWSGFILLLIGVLLLLPFRTIAFLFMFVGIVILLYSFKWSPASQKKG